ncbi:hypothetical protein BJX61DRAFT_510421 [Aspergillus egyptiacus]|nr:hypothetical protein BJX61DRAFT_510421 [Aspergillus egyptiacus]
MDEDMVLWLLDHGAEPNQQCLIDLTPISVAIRDAAVSTIHLLFDVGAIAHKGQLFRSLWAGPFCPEIHKSPTY